MKTKTLLVLCLVSWAFDNLGGIYLVQNLLDKVNPTPGEFNLPINILGNITWFADWFWKFGFPIFFGSLFFKTKKTTWWVWIIALAWYATNQIDDLVWQELLVIQWWDQGGSWIYNTISFLNFLAWIFYGGLIFQKLTKDINFSQFESSASWTSLKEWYLNLIR